MADWAAISSLATAGGTFALAGATFASVRSGQRAARTAERSLLVGLRPLLMPSRHDDAAQKVDFIDGVRLVAPGGCGAAEVGEAAVYLALAVRNVGTGIAVLHGWYLHPSRATLEPPAPLEEFTRLSRDLYVPAADVGFWQGAFRDPESPEFAAARAAIDERRAFSVDVLYGDHEGGQRAITRFGLVPEDDRWRAVAARHWNIDRPDPR